MLIRHSAISRVSQVVEDTHCKELSHTCKDQISKHSEGLHALQLLSQNTNSFSLKVAINPTYGKELNKDETYTIKESSRLT